MMVFQDRKEAAQLLVDRLIQYKGQNPLVLAIPRGAVPMAHIIAQRLDGQMDVVLVHKLGAPSQPEFAIGAIDESGEVHLAPHAAEFGVQTSYFIQEKEAQLETLQKRGALYRSLHPPIDPKERIIIIVDDGIATGETMAAALRATRAKKPAKLIAATAVASSDAFKLIQKLADDVICLEVPIPFYAVGQFFVDFPQVSDEEIIMLLNQK